jgi:cell division protease FtsH
MVGADLANLVNEAALLAARRGHDAVSEADFADALERIVLGAERQVMMRPEDRRRTAYHEAGHAIVGMLTPGADPVRKISIIPRGIALGVTFSAPDDDRVSYARSELLARIKASLGGRAAEELVFQDVTTGAESDLEQVTAIARRMVGRWGMSPAIGKLTVLPADDGRPFGVPDVSPHTLQLIDDEARRIVDEVDAEVHELLAANRDKLDSLAQALLEHETLDEDDAYAAAGVPHIENEEKPAREAALAPSV